MTKIAFRHYFLHALLSVLIPSLAYTQITGEKKFGKNRVQHRELIWSYITTPNFIIKYHDSKYDIANITATYAEAGYSRVSTLVGYKPYNKMKIMVYGSVTDLHQSNIGINEQGYKVGGQTSFVRSEIEIAFTGNKSNYKKNLDRSMADILIFGMMYGGTLKETIKNSYLLNLPNWFMSGAATYIAEGWSEEIDNFMRDLIANKKLNKIQISLIEGEAARKLGQSIWNYIAERYGANNISHILNRTRVIRNVQAAISSTLGIPYKQFITDWKNYYLKQYDEVTSAYDLPEFSQRITPKDPNIILNSIEYSPDGKYLAYTTNRDGKLKVIIRNIATNKQKVIYRAGYKVISQQIDRSLPLISWMDKEVVAVFGAKKGEHFIHFYSVEKKKARQPIDFVRFNHIEGFDISASKRLLVFSGERLGRSDIYTFNSRTKRINRITNDEFDDIDPQFIAGTDQIVFSSNRLSTKFSKKERSGKLEDISDRFNLFIYDPNSPQKLRRLNNTLSKDTKPKAINKNEILFLSDRRGITQLFKYKLSDTITIQLTKFSQSIKNYDISDDKLSIIIFDKNQDKIYQFENFDKQTNKFTVKTTRQHLLDVRSLKELRKKRVKAEIKKKNQKQKIFTDSLKVLLKDTLTQVAAPVQKPQNTAANKNKKSDKEEINDEDYRFDTFSKNTRKKLSDKFKKKLVRKNEKAQEAAVKKDETVNNKLTLSSKYENRFGIDNVITTVFIDPLLRSWGLVFESQMTETMENHKINAGLIQFFNDNNNSFFVEYLYLKKRIDYRVRLERKTLGLTTNSLFNHVYTINKGLITFSYPFSVLSKISVEPFYASTSFTNTNLNQIGNNNPLQHYGGFNAEFVFDNSVITGTNMREGTRVKARYESYFNTTSGGRSFSSLVIDARHYQPVLRYFILAGRISYGKFFGPGSKNFLLGGAENWINNDRTDHDEGDPLRLEDNTDMTDQLFHKFVTHLRGFEWNKIFGENYLLFNAELRVPVAKLLYQKNIESSFLRNLQFLTFTDIGTAWTGVSPFKRENSLNTEVITTKGDGTLGFEARVQNFRNPFLIGYGFGVRTTVLGYYLKFDAAWGLEDNVVTDPRYYFTIGYDF